MLEQKRYQFPEGFLWGAATASYQIEGAVDVDGRKPSVWDTFCATPGKIVDGSSGKDACRHYEKWEEDLDLLKSLGMGTYRFSIAWPRVIPDGRGAVNAKGLDFYERLVDGLLKRGIKPNATLYHWDLPQSLEDKNGWINRDTAYAYAEYADAVAKRLGDRVAFWATFNEPRIFVWLGYEAGIHAPGRQEGPQAVNQAIHHVLLGHGLAIQAIRKHSKSPAGIVLSPASVWPQTNSANDLHAAELSWEDANDWWVLPMLKGKYPEASWKRRGGDVPLVQAGDMAIINQPIDFMGINYYIPNRTVHSDKAPGYVEIPPAPDAPMQSMPSWEIYPAGIEDLLIQFKQRYGNIALYVTENGMSNASDAPGEDGKVHDPIRLNFYRDHLIHCLRAIKQGVNLKGYYAWSFMDNFEWGLGYTQRFGIVHVDYKTFKRTVKDSGAWYRDAAKANGFDGPDLPVIQSGFKRV